MILVVVIVLLAVIVMTDAGLWIWQRSLDSGKRPCCQEYLAGQSLALLSLLPKFSSGEDFSSKNTHSDVLDFIDVIHGVLRQRFCAIS